LQQPHGPYRYGLAVAQKYNYVINAAYGGTREDVFRIPTPAGTGGG
jgi:hypothetical protein